MEKTKCSGKAVRAEAALAVERAAARCVTSAAASAAGDPAKKGAAIVAPFFYSPFREPTFSEPGLPNKVTQRQQCYQGPQHHSDPDIGYEPLQPSACIGARQ